MILNNNELLIELWTHLKTYIPPKERIEAADSLVNIFDEFGLLSENLLQEDLDKVLQVAAKSHFSSFDDDEYDDTEDC